MSWIVRDMAKAFQAGATQDDEILYVLTVADLRSIYEGQRGDGAWTALSEGQRRGLVYTTTRYLDAFCGDGTYTWVDAISDAIQEALSAEVDG